MNSLVRISALALGFILVFVVMIEPGVLVLPFTLATGWWPAASRLLKSGRANPGSIALFGLAIIVLIVGSHLFLRWIHMRLRAEESNRLRRGWSWKWTVCGFGILFCTLLSIASLVLTTHQLFWISRSSDHLFIDPYRRRFVMQDTAVTLQTAAEESQWDAARIREAFWTEGSVAARQAASEAIHLVWIEAENGRLRAIILIPRQPLIRSRASLTLIQPGTNVITRKLDELPQVLASFGIGDLGKKEKAAVLP